MDCSVGYGNNGCLGGHIYKSYSYIYQNGVHNALDYPYISNITNTSFQCQTNFTNPSIFPMLLGYEVIVYPPNLDALQDALYYQVLSVLVSGSSKVFKNYVKGIIRYNCGTQTDTAVNLVGSGTQGNTLWWRIRNSWGTDWGEDGYARLYRGTGVGRGTCGIATYPSYPL